MRHTLPALLLLTACGPTASGETIEPEPDWDGRIVELHADAGDRIVLVGPKIPIHPMFADAVTEAKFDAGHLRHEGTVRDTENYGFSVHVFTFTVLHDGESSVDLVVARAQPDTAGDAAPTARYRILRSGR